MQNSHRVGSFLQRRELHSFISHVGKKLLSLNYVKEYICMYFSYQS